MNSGARTHAGVDDARAGVLGAHGLEGGRATTTDSLRDLP
jgi:hypothetical protein